MLLLNPLYALKHLMLFAVMLILTGCSEVVEAPSTTEDTTTETMPAEALGETQEETSEIVPAEAEEETQAEESEEAK